MGQEESVRREQSVVDAGAIAGSEDHRFAAAVAAFGLKLTNDPHTENMTLMRLRVMASNAIQQSDQREGLLELIDFFRAVSGQN